MPTTPVDYTVHLALRPSYRLKTSGPTKELSQPNPILFCLRSISFLALTLPLHPLPLQPLALLHPPCLQPLGQLRLLRGQLLHRPPPRVHLKPVAPVSAQVGRAQRLPERRRGLPLAPPLVRDGEIVDGLDMGRVPHVRDGRDKALGPRVQEVLRLRVVVGVAPGLRLGVLLWREARPFAEGDQPDGEVLVRDAVEDPREFALVVLPWEVG